MGEIRTQKAFMFFKSIWLVGIGKDISNTHKVESIKGKEE